MELKVVVKNDVTVSPAIKDYATKRVGKMDRYLPSIAEGKIEISKEGARQPDQRFVVQVTLDSNGVLIRAQERGEDITTAVDKVVDALTTRISRYKGKHSDKGKSSVRTMEPLPETSETPVQEVRRVVKTKQFTLKPMALDEAIQQMELLGHDFFLFVNSESGKANLVYLRKDKHYGLIEPDME
ncbi:MAG: ribosome-associated translation inhibitor RaiA [Dehalococcoidia bacterium]|nr:ribosome-associated translation inhibitor RaiA [Dehalococcoidia bacterium]